MKTYNIFVNTNTRPFAEASWEYIGTAQGKNMDEAKKEMKAAIWGRESNANYSWPAGGGNTPTFATMKAEKA